MVGTDVTVTHHVEKKTHHVDSRADENAVVKGPEEGDEETDEPRDEIDPFKIVSSRCNEPLSQDKFLLLLFQMGWMTWCSTLNMTAVMMTAASTAWSKSILMVVWFTKSFYRDLGYEGAVLHETGKTDHDEGSCEQTPSLGLHPAGAVHSCPVDLGVLDQVGFNLIYLENEPVVGMEEKKDPTMLQAPSAIIS